MIRSRILIVINDLGPGGAQNAVRQQVDYLQSTYEVKVLTLDDQNEQSVKEPVLNRWMQKCTRFLRRAQNIRREVKAFKPQVVISHMDGANWLSGLSHRAPKIFVIHGSLEADGDLTRIQRAFRALIAFPVVYRRIGRVVAVSEGIAKEAASLGVRRVHTITNGVDLGTVKKRSQLDEKDAHLMEGGAPWVVICARLHQQKNISQFLGAFRRASRDVDMRLAIIGDGPERGAIEAACRKLDLTVLSCAEGDTHHSIESSSVVMFGYRENPMPYILRASVLALPSMWEGYPLVLGESMAIGVPVMAADCPTGPAEILKNISERDGYGLVAAIEGGRPGILMPLLQSDTEEFWAEELKKIIHSKEEFGQRIADRGFDWARTHSTQAMADKWQQVIRLAIEGG